MPRRIRRKVALRKRGKKKAERQALKRDLQMTLTEYTAEVNRLSHQESDGINARHLNGPDPRPLFGASYTTYDERDCQTYHEAGDTPAQALEDIWLDR